MAAKDLVISAPEPFAAQVLSLITKFNTLFSGKMGRINDHVFHLDTGNAKPISSKAYRMNPPIQMLLKQYLEEMTEAGII